MGGDNAVVGRELGEGVQGETERPVLWHRQGRGNRRSSRLSVSWALLLCVLLCCSTQSALAGRDVWTSHGPEGGSVEVIKIAPSNPEIIYAAAGGGVYKSVDGGETWEAANAGLVGMSVSALGIDSSNPQIVCAGTWGDGVYRSIDGGETWEVANAGLTRLTIRALEIAPSDPQIAYVGVIGRVYKSTDGGQTWANLNFHGGPWPNGF